MDGDGLNVTSQQVGNTLIGTAGELDHVDVDAGLIIHIIGQQLHQGTSCIAGGVEGGAGIQLGQLSHIVGGTVGTYDDADLVGGDAGDALSKE